MIFEISKVDYRSKFKILVFKFPSSEMFGWNNFVKNLIFEGNVGSFLNPIHNSIFVLYHIEFYIPSKNIFIEFTHLC